MFVLGLIVSLVLEIAAARHANLNIFLVDTELEFAFMIHRHGDRTPIEVTARLSNDPAALTDLSKPYGWGQLTGLGKQRSFAMGKVIRNRYDDLLGSRYNFSEVYIRSTDSTRAKMTILTALAAIYRPGDQPWNKNLDWQPVPYTTVPAKYDFNLASMNCRNLIKAILPLYAMRSPDFEQYSDALELLTRKTGLDFTRYPMASFAAHDLFTSQLSLGLPLDPEIQEMFPDIQKAAGLVIEILMGNSSNTPLASGVLLNEFLTHAGAVVDGDDTQRIRIYSAHDFTVYAFEAITQIANRQGVPKYSSIYSLELRRVTATGEYIVVPVYIPSPSEEPVYLQMSGCDKFCSFEQFVEITSPFARDEDTWRSECDFTPDMMFDDSTIA